MAAWITSAAARKSLPEGSGTAISACARCDVCASAREISVQRRRTPGGTSPLIAALCKVMLSATRSR